MTHLWNIQNEIRDIANLPETGSLTTYATDEVIVCLKITHLYGSK